MTNGEKLQSVFPDTKIITQFDNPFGDRFMLFTLNNEDMQVNITWWNAEYKEPTTKNDCAEQNGCITCSLDDGDDCCRKLYEESMKNNLDVDCIDRNSIKYYPGQGGYMYASKGEIDKLPSVIPSSSVLTKNSKKLEKDFGELDCVDRAGVIKILGRIEQMVWDGDGFDYEEARALIDELPSVTPQEPKTGKWISTETKGVRYAFWCRYKCPLCGGLSDHTNFCPNCGAKMEGEET